MKNKSEVKWSEVKWSEGNLLEKKKNKKVTYKDVVNETVICFFISLRFDIQFGWRSVLKTTYKCQILLSATRVVDNITAIIFKNLKCERISEVKSTFSTVVLVLLFGVLVNAEIINDIITDQTFWLNICPLTKLMLLESAQKLRKNGDKVQRVHVDLEVFFPRKP